MYLGIIYSQRSEYEKALLYLFEAEKMADSLRWDILENIINNIAIIYSNTDQNEKAREMYAKLRKTLEANKNENPSTWAKNYINTAKTFFIEKKYKEALPWNYKALQICTQNNIEFGIAISQNALAANYVELKMLDSALFYSQKALEIAQKNKYKRLEVSAMQNLASSLFYGKAYEKSIPYFEKAIENAVQNQDITNHLENLLLLSSVYDSLGKYQKSLSLLKKWRVLNDSAQKMEKQKALVELQTKYETLKKELKINELEQQNLLKDAESAQKNLLIVVLIALVLIIALVSLIIYLQIKQKQKQAILASQKQSIESELAAIKAQMNPHFISNALNSIQEVLLLGDKKEAISYLHQYGVLTRRILEVSQKEYISLSDELEIVDTYVNIESLRVENGIDFKKVIDPDLDTERIAIPPLLLQPFVENSIKHGLIPKNGEKNIVINCKLDKNENLVSITIRDNGIGRAAAQKLNNKPWNFSNSFSISANSRRLQLLNKNQKNVELKYIDLYDEQKNASGTEVVIRFNAKFLY
jgi:two-component sensor histidine kinase